MISFLTVGTTRTTLVSLAHDEQFQLAARSFVRKHAYKKDEPNLAGQKFADWVHSEYDKRIHDRTAYTWVYRLGFHVLSIRKVCISMDIIGVMWFCTGTTS